MRDQNPVLKKCIQITFKMGQDNIIIVKYFHWVTYTIKCKVYVTTNIEIVLTLKGVKTIATNANNNVNVKACFT